MTAIPVSHPEPAIWTGSGPVPAGLKGAVLAIGNFDGVHRGHKALLAAARARAAELSRPVGLVTFEPHPRTVFRPDQPVFRLTPPDTRRSLVAAEGCGAIAELVFDKTFAARSAEAFIHELLIGALDAAAVVVGADFAFGQGRRGDVGMLGRELAEAGRGLIVPEPVIDGEGAVISSSRIRDALADGDVALAGALLGHDWLVRGEIVHGDKRGRLLGFPTANMLLRPDNRLRHGIYAVRMRLDGVWHPAVASFGRRPTFDDGAPRLETFVFDFADDLYGRVVDVAFAGWIRPEMKFDGVDALIAQMQKDSALARAMTA